MNSHLVENRDASGIRQATGAVNNIAPFVKVQYRGHRVVLMVNIYFWVQNQTSGCRSDRRHY